MTPLDLIIAGVAVLAWLGVLWALDGVQTTWLDDEAPR
jgi:hypothetical protein